MEEEVDYYFNGSQISQLPTQTQSQKEDEYDYVVCSYSSIEPVWGRLSPRWACLGVVDLKDSPFKLGRAGSCDVVISPSTHPFETSLFNVSKEHFQITKEESGFAFVTDLSKNGTFLNGILIGRNKRHILQNNDVIAIGRCVSDIVYVFQDLRKGYNMHLPEAVRRRYVLSMLLGCGACGEVHLAYDKITEKPYAVKKISKLRASTSNQKNFNDPAKIETEVNILKSHSHPFIIKMNEIIETDSDVFLVLDYMRGGELTNRILSLDPLPESQVKYFFTQIVSAVMFLHKKGITHRDLKPQNILLSSEFDDDAVIKVSDFGLSKIVHIDTVMETVCGTITYVAPEVLDARFTEYSQQVDIWSLGVLLYYMLSKELPFRSSDKRKLQLKIITGSYNFEGAEWSQISESAKDLIRKMLVVNPYKRITMSGIVQHPWLNMDVHNKWRINKILKQAGYSDSEESGNEEPPVKRFRSLDEMLNI